MAIVAEITVSERVKKQSVNKKRPAFLPLVKP